MMGFLERLIGGALTALHFHAMRFYRHYLTVMGVTVLICVGAYVLLRAPFNFAPATITIGQGESALQVADELSAAHVTTAGWPLWFILRISHGDSHLRTGTYRFNTPENVFSVTRRLLTADYGMPVAKITFIEGETIREMAAQVHEALPSISVQAFMAAANGQEGYLFPDTYFFPPASDARAIVSTMRINFDTKTASLRDSIAASGHSIADIVIMASLVEKEARTDESRATVAGILWNRVAKGMPLQVDAVFGYIFNRDTYSPSPSDLKVDSPYNTYTHKGLPPGPINNPGISALQAAIHPTKTSYLYYLTGSDDKMHYSVTYVGHQANLAKYLQ